MVVPCLALKKIRKKNLIDFNSWSHTAEHGLIFKKTMLSNSYMKNSAMNIINKRLLINLYQG